jgi:hypothetical protein
MINVKGRLEMNKKSVTGKLFGCTLIAAVIVSLTGCSKHSDDQTSVMMTPVQDGAQMQESGIMSQKNFLRIHHLEEQVSRTGAISSADLTWTLTFLKNSSNAIARARAMTTLSEIRPMSPAQKAEIQPAIAPYIDSPNPLDREGAKIVERAMTQ